MKHQMLSTTRRTQLELKRARDQEEVRVDYIRCCFLHVLYALLQVVLQLLPNANTKLPLKIL